jgi:pimeloyl-ACP methyl ester carboxylesterase
MFRLTTIWLRMIWRSVTQSNLRFNHHESKTFLWACSQYRPRDRSHHGAHGAGCRPAKSAHQLRLTSSFPKNLDIIFSAANLVSDSEGRTMAAHLGCDFIELPDAGHTPSLETPEGVNRQIVTIWKNAARVPRIARLGSPESPPSRGEDSARAISVSAAS